MSEAVQAYGKIQANGAEAQQYGSHILQDERGNDQYALRSENVDLNDHAGQTVTVSGSLDPEYAMGTPGGGPALLIVTDVERGESERRSL